MELTAPFRWTVSLAFYSVFTHRQVFICNHYVTLPNYFLPFSAASLLSLHLSVIYFDNQRKIAASSGVDTRSWLVFNPLTRVFCCVSFQIFIKPFRQIQTKPEEKQRHGWSINWLCRRPAGRWWEGTRSGSRGIYPAGGRSASQTGCPSLPHGSTWKWNDNGKSTTTEETPRVCFTRHLRALHKVLGLYSEHIQYVLQRHSSVMRKAKEWGPLPPAAPVPHAAWNLSPLSPLQ